MGQDFPADTDSSKGFCGEQNLSLYKHIKHIRFPRLRSEGDFGDFSKAGPRFHCRFGMRMESSLSQRHGKADMPWDTRLPPLDGCSCVIWVPARLRSDSKFGAADVIHRDFK